MHNWGLTKLRIEIVRQGHQHIRQDIHTHITCQAAVSGSHPTRRHTELQTHPEAQTAALGEDVSMIQEYLQLVPPARLDGNCAQHGSLGALGGGEASQGLTEETEAGHRGTEEQQGTGNGTGVNRE